MFRMRLEIARTTGEMNAMYQLDRPVHVMLVQHGNHPASCQRACAGGWHGDCG